MSKHINLMLGISRKAHLALLIAAVTLTAFTVQAQSWTTSLSQARSAISWATSANPSQAMQTGSQLQAEIITITPRGFEPLEITRTAGRFILMVENRADLEDVTFRLDQENGNRLYEKELPREQPDWSEIVDLQPGVYVLTEAAHSDWLCRITVTAE